MSGPYTDFLGSRTVNTALYNARAPKTFQYLRAIEPYLYSAPGLLGQKNTYPPANAAVDTLFGQLKIALTLSYDPTYAAAQLANGQWNRTNPQVPPSFAPTPCTHNGPHRLTFFPRIISRVTYWTRARWPTPTTWPSPSTPPARSFLAICSAFVPPSSLTSLRCTCR